MAIPGPLLAALADPNVTYLLFILGIVGLVAEGHHPGTLVPGIAGALALVLAIIGFGELGINAIGLALVVLAAGLFVAEAHAPRYGLLALGGLLAFVAGSWFLFVPPAGAATAAAGRHVSPWLIALGALALGGYALVVVRAVLHARRLRPVTGPAALLGRDGVATSALAPRGIVRVGGEDWSAVTEFAPIEAGEAVEVLAVEGLTLHVHRPHEWGTPPEGITR